MRSLMSLAFAFSLALALALSFAFYLSSVPVLGRLRGVLLQVHM